MKSDSLEIVEAGFEMEAVPDWETPASVSNPLIKSNHDFVVFFNPADDDDTDRASSPVAWDHIHGLVQESFEGLTQQILRALATIRSKEGRTAGPAFPLFSYRTFDHQATEDDPLVVGITFSTAGNQVRVSGDLSGEESGIVYYDEDCEEYVPNRQAEVAEAATRVARRLVSQESLILTLLGNDSIMPRG